jgi:HSP20 family protein
MRLKSLVPFREPGQLVRPDFGLFALHREIDRLFNEFAQHLGLNRTLTNIIPSIDVCETDKAIEVSAEMPGLERKDVEISIEDDTLTIRGEKKRRGRAEGQERSAQRAELRRLLSRAAVASRR